MLLTIEGTFKALNTKAEEPFKFVVTSVNRRLWKAVRNGKTNKKQEKFISNLVDKLITSEYGNLDGGLIYTTTAVNKIEYRILQITEDIENGNALPEGAFQLGTIYEKLRHLPKTKERDRLILLCDDIIEDMNYKYENGGVCL